MDEREPADDDPIPEDGAPDARADEIDELLRRMGAGDDDAESRLFDLLCDELRKIAHSRMRRQPDSHTLETDALVNEAFLRLRGLRSMEWVSRKHFLCVAARAMQHILIDHARSRNRGRRRPPGDRLTLSGLAAKDGGPEFGVLAAQDAIEEIAKFDPVGAQMLRYVVFAGYTIPQVAKLLELGLRSAQRKWRAVLAVFLERLQ